jgi:[calcium/calmodulin-dependent protein kinase] kinase
MKKLYHPNLVSLIEVLDDPEEDTLYMVMEYCKNGVVMKVGLEERADPYDEEQCRHWFRDMILGIEYLHAQGIIHRDIKPDNCLVTEEGVLKIVDFGVSEMFEKDSEMNTAKSAGSPAFMPPELCVAKHGHISGRAADIWSMGVTLYCLRFGRIPFEKQGIVDLYESIKNDDVELGQCDDDFRDLMLRILKKDPQQRITMEELREHSWVTCCGSDPLLSREENVKNLIEPPTDAELQAAITGNMGRLLVVMKAVKKFKKLLLRRRPDLIEGIFGRASRIVQPPMQMETTSHPRAQSEDTYMRRPIEAALTTEGVHREIPVSDDLTRLPKHIDTVETLDKTSSERPHPRSHKLAEGLRQGNTSHGAAGDGHPIPIPCETGKGQAHNPLEDMLFLDIGAGSNDASLVPGRFHVVSESPGAVDMNIFEKAYQEEIERILAKDKKPTIYLTRRVEHNKDIRENEHITDHSREQVSPFSGRLASLVQKARVLSVHVQDANERVESQNGKENVEKTKHIDEQKQPT